MSAPANFYKAFLAVALPAGTPVDTIVVDRLTTLAGETIATGDFVDLGRGVITVNPDADGLTSFPESISFETVNATDSSLETAIRGLDKSSVSQTTLMRYHPIGTALILSFGSQQIQDILTYVDESVADATFGTSNVVAGTAGENVSQGNVIYLKNDGKWWKADADLIATLDGVQLAIAQGTGLMSGSITGGVLLVGVDNNQTGLVAGTTYYLSNTAGAISSSPGTNSKVLGVARSTTSLYFNPIYGNVPTLTQVQFIALFMAAATGVVFDYAGTTVPTGFLACDGAAVSRTTYAALFTAIGTSWGGGDGSTTFNVPDLRGRTTIGSGTGSKVATFASRSSNVITVTGLSNIANNEFQTGQAVTYHSAGSVITGLTNDTVYYLVRTGNLTFSLATTLALAQAGTAIALSSDGTGVQTFTLALTARTTGQTGGEENHALSLTEMVAHHHPLLGWANSSSSPETQITRASSFSGSSNYSTDLSSGGLPIIGDKGGNVAMNIMQPSGVMTKIIKI